MSGWVRGDGESECDSVCRNSDWDSVSCWECGGRDSDWDSVVRWEYGGGDSE